MKIIVKDDSTHTEQSPMFPKIYQHVENTKLIVWFSDYRVGIKLSRDTENEVISGKSEEDWITCSDGSIWKEFKGEITLKND